MDSIVSQSERSARKFVYKTTRVTKGLYLEHPQSKVTAFASSDDHTIFLSLPQCKIFAQQKQIHAVFYLKNGQTRYLIIDEYIWLPKMTESLPEFKRSDPQADDQSSPFTWDQLSAEFMFTDLSKYEEQIPDYKPPEVDLEEGKGTFTYTAFLHVHVCLDEKIRKLTIETPHLYITAPIRDKGSVDINITGDIEQSVSFDGNDFRIST